MDLRKLKGKVQDRMYAEELYAAMCNMCWQHVSDVTNVFGCTWRSAGGIVADLRGLGEKYTDFYCTGGEGDVTSRIEKDLNRIGWYPYEEEEKKE